MHLFETVMTRISRGLDFIAGLALAATALLVVANILGRVLLQRPILGTYEMVGFLTAVVVGFSLSRCALENSHIAVEFILERFPMRLQKIVEPVTGIPVISFLAFAAVNLIAYGTRIAESGQVSPTTQIIFYPFIYLVALGFLALALIELMKLLKLLFGGTIK